MKRLHRAGLAGLVLGGLLTGAVRADDRLVSLLPPVGRAETAPAGANPFPVAPYEPGGGLVKPRGANLARGAVMAQPGPLLGQPGTAGPSPAPLVAVPEGCAPTEAAAPASAAVSTEIVFPVPNIRLPDVGAKAAEIFCSGEHNPADVDDPTWFRAEFLMWWFKKANLPPLATTSDDPADLGILGAPTTRVLFGGGNQALPMKLGGRVAIGSWLDPSEALGIEVGYMFLINRSLWFDGKSAGGFLLARPFFNVLDGFQDSALVATPDIPEFDISKHPGRLIIELPGRFDSGELSCVSNYCRGATGRIDAICGIRYLFLGEGVNFYETFKIPDQSPELPGLTYVSEESFGAKNYMYTGQVGVRTENRWGCLTLNMEAKLAVGWNHMAAKLISITHVSENQRDRTSRGGLLVLKSNAGGYNDDSLIVIPEVGFRLAYEIKDHITLTAGYSFLYLSNVWRPGEMIDLNVNPNLIPPVQNPQHPSRPTFQNDPTGFYAGGITLGLEIKY